MKNCYCKLGRSSNFLWLLKKTRINPNYLFPKSRMFYGWLTVWPNVGIKGRPSFLKLVQTVNGAVFTSKVIFFKIAPKVTKIFGLFLKESLLSRTFKNWPICSLCLEGIFFYFSCFCSLVRAQIERDSVCVRERKRERECVRFLIKNLLEQKYI